ncbi:cancer/testis antigen 55 [Erinaceus europaeus]|uniref:Cancer/testis antigen 55 n=1 Tax=Erinaceus europaeus TaxID=9365 RepID=A0A1S3APF4_ERIEU|nr:cancer/testis antigen 55 [Erinaceus europaeus]
MFTNSRDSDSTTAYKFEFMGEDQSSKQFTCDGNFQILQGIVTKFCGDYGLIDGLIYFSSDVVTSNMPLKVGQNVSALVEEDKISHELKIIKVDALCDNCHDDEQSDICGKVPLDSLKSLMECAEYNSHTTYFSLDVICKDFEPYQGDCVEVEFSIHPETQSRKALSVKPLRHKHLSEVCITNIQGRNGVIGDDIFFTLDSLKLPDGYTPRIADVVNVIVVENILSCYHWRAISITLLKRA